MTVCGSADKWVDEPGEFSLSPAIRRDEENDEEDADGLN